MEDVVAVAVFDGEDDLDEDMHDGILGEHVEILAAAFKIAAKITTINVLDEQQLFLLLLVDVEVNEIHNIWVGDVGEDVSFMT